MKRVLLISFVCLAITSCGKSGPTVTLSDPDGETLNITVEIARTPAELSQGLMGRTELLKDHGMLFVFKDSFIRSFWMKNTLIPLDILYFNDQGEFVSSASMVPCTQDPCALYSSSAPAMYALEVAAGFLETHAAGPGWTMTLEE